MASTGRYQSKLFNFLNRQSRRLIDTGDRAVRQFKVATEWAAQVVLYPIYLLLQTTQLAGRQFKQTVQQSWQRLQAAPDSDASETPATDTAIQQVLLTIQTWDLPAAVEVQPSQTETSIIPSLPKHWDLIVTPVGELAPPHTNGAIAVQTETPLTATSAHSTLVRGVATLVTTKNLVLVTPENQILDILTPEQQQTLYERIIWEVANFWHQQKSFQPSDPKPKSLQAIAKRSSLLAPVRLFWQAMAWVQTSPVAIAINLFGEASLLDAPQLQAQPNLAVPESDSWLKSTLRTFSPASPAWLTRLDSTVAEIETHQLAPVTERSHNLVDWVRSQFGGWLQKPQNQPSPPDPLLDPWEQLPSPSLASETITPQAETQPQVQNLIRAAIDYFFGYGKRKISESEVETWLLTGETEQELRLHSPESITEQTQPQLSAATLPIDGDDWLTSIDLFGEPKNITQEILTSSPATPAALPAAPDIDLTEGKSTQNLLRRSLLSFRQLLKRETKIPRPTPPTVKPDLPQNTQPVTSSPIAPVSRPQPPAQPKQRSASNLQRHQVHHSAPARPQASPARERYYQVDPDPFPDWIETDARPVGYVKHPLERLLEWLDRLVLGVENAIAHLWQWLRRRI